MRLLVGISLLVLLCSCVSTNQIGKTDVTKLNIDSKYDNILECYKSLAIKYILVSENGDVRKIPNYMDRIKYINWVVARPIHSTFLYNDFSTYFI